eukprot:3454145-Rhodomonas_salina.1
MQRMMIQDWGAEGAESPEGRHDRPRGPLRQGHAQHSDQRDQGAQTDAAAGVERRVCLRRPDSRRVAKSAPLPPYASPRRCPVLT